MGVEVGSQRSDESNPFIGGKPSFSLTFWQFEVFTEQVRQVFFGHGQKVIEFFDAELFAD